MRTYKLFRQIKGKLYPLYVDATTEMELGVWLSAKVGIKADDTHVKSRLGALSLRPGFHSTEIPFTDWIGKRTADGNLIQKKGTVWCECDVEGTQIHVTAKNGLRTLPQGWYYFKTNSKQVRPWIISDKIRINRILTNQEVAEICHTYGIEPQEVEI